MASRITAPTSEMMKPVTLKGSVVKWEMIKPHGWIAIDVPAADGKVTKHAITQAKQVSTGVPFGSITSCPTI